MGLEEKKKVFKCSFVIGQICLLNEPLLQYILFLQRGARLSCLSDHLLQAIMATQDKLLYVLILWLIPRYLFNLIHVQIGSVLPTALRIQAMHSTQGMGWHSAYHHTRALSLGWVCCQPAQLALQLMGIQMETELTHSCCCCCLLPEALCAPVPATWWHQCGELTRALWSRYASCVCVCILL